MTTESFILKARSVHGDRYDYSQVEYIQSQVPVTIVCPEHGAFKQAPANHLRGQGCHQCGLTNRRSPNRKTTEEFVRQAKECWGNQYDYSETIYTNKATKIAFLCPKHGKVEQSPVQHLKNGCPYCAGRGIGKHTKASFIKRAKEIHGEETYDYDQVEFSSIHDKVTIVCPTHGAFQQKAANHINLGNGCPQCKGGVSIGREEFLRRAQQKHGDKFDYKQTEYKRAHQKVKITCLKHGEFEQLAYVHLQSDHACPMCVAELSSSKAEEEIRRFVQKHFDGQVKANDRATLNGLEIDILIPEINLGIEFNGTYWHTESTVGRTHHVKKTNLAEENGIHLIQIFEYEWESKRTIVESRILNQLGVCRKIFARQTKVVKLSVEQKNIFLDRTHIQGTDSNSSILLGLEYQGEIVACMTFGKPRFNKKFDWELIRFASEIGCSVIGGASKILKHFRKEHFGSIVSYADRRWSSGNMYRTLGFDFDGVTTPGYVYYDFSRRRVVSRMKFQKHKLCDLPFYDESLSEYEIMKKNKFDRLWNCGHSRWILT